MSEVFLCDGVRTPFGRYGGALSSVRVDDLAAMPLKALMARNTSVDWDAVDDVYYGCANQAGEDNRNVARMAVLLAGLPTDVPAATINRLCGSSMDAVGICARAIRAGEAELMIAGGVEGMSRAPFVMPKADSAFSRSSSVFDTTLGWRFVNSQMKAQYGIDSMPETAENVANDFAVARADQDAFAQRSQQRYSAALARGFFDDEIVAVTIPGRKSDTVVSKDEHPRETTLDALAQTERRRQARRQRHCRQRIRHQRRRGCVSDRKRRCRPQIRIESSRSAARSCYRRRAAADHGNRPGTSDAKASRALQAENCGHRRDRT